MNATLATLIALLCLAPAAHAAPAMDLGLEVDRGVTLRWSASDDADGAALPATDGRCSANVPGEAAPATIEDCVVSANGAGQNVYVPIATQKCPPCGDDE